MQGFTYIDLIILVVYLAAVLFAGLHFAKKEMKGKEYFKGDGTVPWWVTSVSIFATLLSPISFLSLAGNSYAGTWIMWFAQLGMLLAIPITIKFFLPIYSKLDIDTAYHYLELRFESKGLRVLGAVMFIVYQIGRMSIIMYLPCMVLGSGGNQAIVEVALTQLGNEGGQPYWSWYGFEGRVEWCACFVSWCADQCGYIESGIILKFAGCVDGSNWFKGNGQWKDRNYEPQAGDIIFFDWEGDGETDHVGIVEKCENGVVYTVEGNSGDTCRQNQYTVGSSSIYGYGVPAY